MLGSATDARKEDFDFSLPADLWNELPLRPRGQARLMVVDRGAGDIEHLSVVDLPSVLSGYVSYVNTTGCAKNWLWADHCGRKFGVYMEYGPLVSKDGALPALIEDGQIRREVTPATLDDGSRAIIRRCPRADGGAFAYLVELERIPHSDCWHYGWEMQGGPDAPGRTRRIEARRFEPVYAESGSSAAPATAGAMLTDELVDAIRPKRLDLSIGVGSLGFVGDTTCSSEAFFIEEDPEVFGSCSIAAIGTTCVKALESSARGIRRKSDLYISPPFEFKAISALVTNFHAPRQKLLALTCAFGGYDLTMRAYQEAVREKYLFGDYGDLMVIV